MSVKTLCQKALHPQQHSMAQAGEQLLQRPYVTTTITPNKIAHLVLKRKPVNSLNRILWRSIRETISELEENWYPNRVRCLVISSGLTRAVFSAGNDLGELFKGGGKGRNYFREFWIESGLALTKLYSSRLITICVINGACAAGGCIIALCCDYRVGCRGMSMGLNEANLGVPAPKYWVEVLKRQVGTGRSEALLMLGSMLQDDDSLKVGFVNELTKNTEEGFRRAMLVGEEWLKVDNAGRETNKLQLRSELAREWRMFLEKEADQSYELLTSPMLVEKLAAVRAKLGAHRNASAKL